MDLLTITAMPATALSEHLLAQGCTYAQLRKRGTDLWHTQTITMDTVQRKAAREELELKLRNDSLANCVETFRKALHGHEHELFHRFLFMLVAVDHVDCDDQACVEASMQCLTNAQNVQGRKRKRGPSMQLDSALGGKHGEDRLTGPPGAKHIRAGVSDLDTLAVLVGLAGISHTQIVESGVALYCERQRRPSGVAQRYATKHIQDSLPQVNTPDLLRFFYYLLGAVIFDILRDDLRAQAEARMRPRQTSHNSYASAAADSPAEDACVQTLIDAFRDVVERRSQNYTAFERRYRVRQLADAAMQADSSTLAQTFYEHFEPSELEAWSHMLHALGREDLWRPL